MPTFSIVTGNGFVGNAQRIEEIWVYGYFYNNQYTFENGIYDLSFKYRSNWTIRIVFGNSDFHPFPLIDTCPPNTGNATSKTVSSFDASSNVGEYLAFTVDNTTTSNTTMTIPTSHPTTMNFTVGTGLDITSGMNVVVGGAFQNFYGVVNSYNSGTGAISVDSTSNFGVGTLSSWPVEVVDAWIEIDEINLTKQ